LLNYVQLTFTAKVFIHPWLYIMKHRLEIISTENGKRGGVTVHEKEKALVNGSQIIHHCLLINGSRINRHNVIHNTSIKLLPSDT